MRNCKGYRLNLVKYLFCFAAISGFLYSSTATADKIPNSANALRLNTKKKFKFPNKPPAPVIKNNIRSQIDIPADAKKVSFVLKEINFSGFTAFKKEEVESIYRDYINKKITLDKVWEIANQITNHYQNEGYFLTKAYVPAQKIKDGQVIIKLSEGYVKDVVLDDPTNFYDVIHTNLIDELKQKKPLNIHDLESFALRMNDLPGQKIEALLEPTTVKSEAIRLRLKTKKKADKISFTFNNFGSKFLGPYQAKMTYQYSFIPLHQTNISILAALPAKKLHFINLNHQIPLENNLKLDFLANFVKSKPGSTLKINRIRSSSQEYSLGISWQPIRRRLENLIYKIELVIKNSATNILRDIPITRDNIRVAKFILDYEKFDNFGGYNFVDLTLNKGLSILNASKRGNINASRENADPDFTTLQINYARLQNIAQNVTATAQIQSQLDSGTLYSSEEFGYGGSNIGRAYSSSEITGDRGIAASFQVNYLGLDPWQKVKLIPSIFYDVGKIWKNGKEEQTSHASSFGFGFDFKYEKNINFNIDFAFPLKKKFLSSTYKKRKPKIFFQLNFGF